MEEKTQERTKKIKAESKTGSKRWSQSVALEGSFTRPPVGGGTTIGGDSGSVIWW